jgi:hypothetical protein
MRVLQEPGAIGLLLGSEQIDRFVHPRVWHVSDRAEVFEGTQHVVVPADRKRELQPSWVDDFAGALTPEQLRSRRYSSPRRRAAMDSAEPPVARSCAHNPSRTLIVVANDERTEPFSASQIPAAIVELLTE